MPETTHTIVALVPWPAAARLGGPYARHRPLPTRRAVIALTVLALFPRQLLGRVQPITNIVATSAANFEPGLPSPGSLGAIFCLGLKDIQGTIAANTVPLPRELAGVRVTIGGAAAPLLSVSAVNGYFQINFQTPQEARLIEPADPPWVEVRIEQLSAPDRQRIAEGSATLRLRPKPGDFFMLAIDRADSTRVYGQPAVFRASDFSLITPANPARRGDILTVFATGLAPTSPVVPTGTAAPFVPLAQVPFVAGWPPGWVAKGTVVSANGRKIIPLFVGLAPGLVGVYQINFRLEGTEVPYEGAFFLQIERIECPEGSYSCRQLPTTYWQSKLVLVPYQPD